MLKNASRRSDNLTLTVELNGVTYTAKIATQLSEDFLILLRHMLLQHWGEALEAVENVDVGFNHLK